MTGGFNRSTDSRNIHQSYNSSDGVNWSINPNNTSFPPRAGHQMIPYRNKLQVIGGQSPNSSDKIKSNPLRIVNLYNDVWSSVDGTEWNKEFTKEDLIFPARYDHKIVNFKEALQMVGGWSNQHHGKMYNDIWMSFNAVDWILVKENAKFRPRSYFSLTVFKNKIYMIGGRVINENGDFEEVNEIWTSHDGVNYNLLDLDQGSDQIFSPRFGHSVTEYDGKLQLIGGRDQFKNEGPHGDSGVQFSDVWVSNDGQRWDKVQENDEYRPSVFHNVIVSNNLQGDDVDNTKFKNKLLVIAGQNGKFTNEIYTMENCFDIELNGQYPDSDVDESTYSNASKLTVFKPNNAIMQFVIKTCTGYRVSGISLEKIRLKDQHINLSTKSIEKIDNLINDDKKNSKNNEQLSSSDWPITFLENSNNSGIYLLFLIDMSKNLQDKESFIIRIKNEMMKQIKQFDIDSNLIITIMGFSKNIKIQCKFESNFEILSKCIRNIGTSNLSWTSEIYNEFNFFNAIGQALKFNSLARNSSKYQMSNSYLIIQSSEESIPKNDKIIENLEQLKLNDSKIQIILKSNNNQTNFHKKYKILQNFSELSFIQSEDYFYSTLEIIKNKIKHDFETRQILSTCLKMDHGSDHRILDLFLHNNFNQDHDKNKLIQMQLTKNLVNECDVSKIKDPCQSIKNIDNNCHNINYNCGPCLTEIGQNQKIKNTGGQGLIFKRLTNNIKFEQQEQFELNINLNSDVSQNILIGKNIDNISYEEVFNEEKSMNYDNQNNEENTQIINQERENMILPNDQDQLTKNVRLIFNLKKYESIVVKILTQHDQISSFDIETKQLYLNDLNTIQELDEEIVDNSKENLNFDSIQEDKPVIEIEKNFILQQIVLMQMTMII